MFVNLAMKRLMYYNLPRKPLISLFVLNVSMSSMVQIFSGSTSIPLSLTMWPSNFPEVTPKVHFLGFNRSLNYRILSKNLYNVAKGSTLSHDFTIMSSTYTSTSLCIYRPSILFPNTYILSYGCHTHPSFSYGTVKAPFNLSRFSSLKWACMWSIECVCSSLRSVIVVI